MSDVNACISQDLWFEIFKELPVKTLGKCRCVCKSWRSLIVSPSFMAAHLKHYTRNDANTIILYKEIVESSKTSRYIHQISLFGDLVMLKQGNRLHTSICPFDIPQTWLPGFKFVGSVNGLLCVSYVNYFCPKVHILIWNPLIRKSIELPDSTVRGGYSVVGFGYDCQMNDHRVVKISYFDANMQLVEVYSVQERTWERICAKYLVHNSIKIVSASYYFYNGVIHWQMVSEKLKLNSSIRKCLLLFNVVDKRFAKMKLPEEIVTSGSGDFGIFEYQGMLSVSHSVYGYWDMNNTTQCQVWVKRVYNVESSWCKILNVRTLHGYCHMGRPVQYLGANKELIGFAKESTGQLVSYDTKTDQITELGLRVGSSSMFIAYSESLALLDQKIDDLIADEL